MRELQMHPPVKKSRQPVDIVRRLQFFANGAELVAWIGPERFTPEGRTGFTNALHTFDFARGASAMLDGGDSSFNLYEERTPDPVLSPDRGLCAFESRFEYEPGELRFEGLSEDEEQKALPHLLGCEQGLGGFAFTPDGEELIAVRNIYEGTHLRGGRWAPDVVRFEMASLKKPPVRYEEKANPFNGDIYRVPVYDVGWLPVMNLPHRKVATVALSANGKLLAVGGVGAEIHVTDLTRKEIVASFPWEGRFLRDGQPVRVAFSPDAKWVVMLANGRLFARPFGAGKAWQTKGTLGYAHDFAFHPDGRVLCAVFRDGQSRYLDPLTGKVRQAFKWAKKPQPLYSVCFAPDGLTCAAGGENGKVVVWDVDA